MNRFLPLALAAAVAGGSRCARAEVESPYTPVIRQLATTPRTFAPENAPGAGNPLAIRCYVTPGNEDYVGVGQWMSVHARWSAVTAVLDDFDHYQELFPDLEKMKVLSREGDHIDTYWEDHIPIFFIPNVKYRMRYWVSTPRPLTRVYRYQLLDGNRILKSDGIIVIQSDSETAETTRYFELDFVDADWGFARSFGPSRIWTDTVRGIFLSDIAILLKAQHPDWSYEKIHQEWDAFLKPDPIAPCVKGKLPFTLDALIR